MQGPVQKELGLMTQALMFTAQRLQLRRSNRPMMQRDLRNNNMPVKLLVRPYPTRSSAFCCVHEGSC